MKKLIMLSAFILIGMLCFSQGFPVLVQEPQPPQLTPQQDWNNATGVEKLYVFHQWMEKKKPHAVRPDRSGIKPQTVKWIYIQLNGMVQSTTLLMSGKVLITPAVYNDEGEIVTPAVYNTIPSSANALHNELAKDYPFTTAEINKFITDFIKYSGCGDWTTFKNAFK